MRFQKHTKITIPKILTKHHGELVTEGITIIIILHIFTTLNICQLIPQYGVRWAARVVIAPENFLGNKWKLTG
jgi:hypothetical protein